MSRNDGPMRRLHTPNPQSDPDPPASGPGGSQPECAAGYATHRALQQDPPPGRGSDGEPPPGDCERITGGPRYRTHRQTCRRRGRNRDSARRSPGSRTALCRVRTASSDEHAGRVIAQTLCLALELHDTIEKEVFYPAVLEIDSGTLGKRRRPCRHRDCARRAEAACGRQRTARRYRFAVERPRDGPC